MIFPSLTMPEAVFLSVLAILVVTLFVLSHLDR